MPLGPATHSIGTCQLLLSNKPPEDVAELSLSLADGELTP
jgi:hypothetical protein